MDMARSPSLVVLGKSLGVHPRQLRRWLSYGVTDEQAEHLAMRLGLMPEEVWEGWFDIDLSSLEEEEVWSAAQEQARRQQVLARRARNAARRRARETPEQRAARLRYLAEYRSNPREAERRRLYSKNYYAEHRAEVLAAQAERDRRSGRRHVRRDLEERSA